MATRTLVFLLAGACPLALLARLTARHRNHRPAFCRCEIADLGESSPGRLIAGINNRGQIVGPDKRWGHCPVLCDGNDSEGTEVALAGLNIVGGINDRGEVVGAIAPQMSGGRAAIWTMAGQACQLPLFQEAEGAGASARDIVHSCALDINNSGQAVGFYTTADGQCHGVLWDKASGMHDMSALFRSQVYRVTGINDSGQIVGAMDKVGAFFWSASTGVIRIDAGGLSRTGGISNSGWVVGKMQRDGEDCCAFLWHRHRGVVDLNDLLAPNTRWRLEGASGINDQGQIVGWGTLGNKSHHYLLQVHGLQEWSGFRH